MENINIDDELSMRGYTKSGQRWYGNSKYTVGYQGNGTGIITCSVSGASIAWTVQVAQKEPIKTFRTFPAALEYLDNASHQHQEEVQRASEWSRLKRILSLGKQRNEIVGSQEYTSIKREIERLTLMVSRLEVGLRKYQLLS